MRQLALVCRSGRRRAYRAVSRPGSRRLHVTTRILGSLDGVTAAHPVIAFTFDDGPNPSETPRILTILDTYGARATFFVLAGRAQQFPEVVRSIRARGHEVGLHGDTHRKLTNASTREIVRVILGGKRRLEQVLGERVHLFRPPFGYQNLRSYALARALGMQVIAWSAAAQDWRDLEVGELVRRGLEQLSPGGILLLHDGYEPETDDRVSKPSVDRAELLSLLLTEVQTFGWTVVSVGELLAQGRPHRKLWF